MSAPLRYSTLMLLVFVGTACERGTPTAPEPATPPVVVPVSPVPPAPGGSTLLEGRWEGSSTVESILGESPSCIAPFWRPAATEAFSAEIRLAPPGLDMVLHQRASENCHVRVGEGQDRVSGEPWPYDEFDCALVPSLCGLGCHFRLSSSDWNCEGAPPEVWILGVAVTGTLDAESPDRMQGRMEITYDHRPGNYPAPGGGWKGVTVVSRFDLRKVPR